jgi:hypothetical protein
MSIAQTVRDVENYPNSSKTVTLDLQQIIPVDDEGNEVYVLTAATTAKAPGNVSIGNVFIREYKAGYARSSGLKSPPFNITSSNNQLRVSLDGSAYQTVVLTSGNGLSGEDVAQDLENKITAAVSGNLSFLNATVEFVNNKFLVVAGSISNSFTGVGKSSVQILPGSGNDASTTLGFDIVIASENVAGLAATETSLTTSFSGSGTMQVNNTAGLVAGQAFVIMDGTNKEYFIASSIGANAIGVSGTLVHTYSSGALVQHIFERDPDLTVASPYTDVDSIVRFALRGTANQIDFSI